MNSAYKSFAQVLSKTLAIEGVEVTKEVPQLAKYDALRSNSVSILKAMMILLLLSLKITTQKLSIQVKMITLNKQKKPALQ